ncbi:hypothetical protein [Achromobacter phage Motura]|uniref:Uncharacterized protein n=1 Tax=Achromobacter phage Motura TaxID=2591403 RepID=A0A514CSY1_9CAUD|nr:hypothetical protein H1O15_gp191 [Achromobacter phage Motura]QDH83597.1 hypothetical protein [Achromobacter phage Motura]
MAKKRVVTVIANTTRVAQNPVLRTPSGEKTSVFIQELSRVNVEPGTTVDNNWNVMNAGVLVVFENQPHKHGWEVDDQPAESLDDEDEEA